MSKKKFNTIFRLAILSLQAICIYAGLKYSLWAPFLMLNAALLVFATGPSVIDMIIANKRST